MMIPPPQEQQQTLLPDDKAAPPFALESEPLDGLVLVQASPDVRGFPRRVSLYVIYCGELHTLRACKPEEAQVFLAKAQRLICWEPCGIPDEVSGLWYAPELVIPIWVRHWPKIKGCDLLALSEAERMALFQEEGGPGMTTTPEGQSAAEQAQVLEAISELTARWGYRDVTELLRQHLRDTPPEEEDQPTFEYLCVLQSPEGGPIYCRTSRRLFKELEASRNANMPYEEGCPAPDPRKHMWMITGGNFDLDDDEEDQP